MGMNPEVKADWEAKLLSGEYLQGRRQLLQVIQHDDGTETREYCCLGVLCETAVLAGIISPAEYNVRSGKWEYDGEWEFVPDSVRIWAELDRDNPAIAIRSVGNNPYTDTLADANDGGLTFVDIAAITHEEL